MTGTGVPWEWVWWVGEHLGAPERTLGAPGSTWERRQQVWECGWQAWKHRQPWDHLGAPVSSLRATRITVEQSGKSIIFGIAAGAPGNHSYYPSFNDFENSCIQFVFSSNYLYCYPSTQGISGLAAGGAWEEFKVHLKMTIEWTQRYTPRPWSS